MLANGVSGTGIKQTTHIPTIRHVAKGLAMMIWRAKFTFSNLLDFIFSIMLWFANGYY